MELPHIGLRCIIPECKQLDFLPIKCDACNGIFCAEHYKYSQHNCAEARESNNVVPVCEKCQTLVPPKNLSADDAMKLHLLNHCSPYKKERIYTNRFAHRRWTISDGTHPSFIFSLPSKKLQ